MTWSSWTSKPTTAVKKVLKLREELLSVEEDRMRGSEGYSIDEVTSMMRSAIKEAAGHGAAK